jgi:hypothetical protein
MNSIFIHEDIEKDWTKKDASKKKNTRSGSLHLATHQNNILNPFIYP